MAYPPPPYADAVCGEFVCGEAVCGTYWAYPERSDLHLVGYLPEAYEIAEVPTALLALWGTVPSFSASSTFSIGQAQLLLHVEEPDYVGVEWLTPAAEIEIGLGVAACQEIVLAPSTCTDIVLEPAGER